MKITAFKIYKPLLAFCILSLLFTLSACDDYLSSDSPRMTTSDQFTMSSLEDNRFSLIGINASLQKLAESYVLLGELRADLMMPGEKSDPSLVEINDLNITKENAYVRLNDYYNVINNCNYFISKLDTARLDLGQKIQILYYADFKAIRAWTYMQIALNFKTAKYYTTPILTVEDANKTYPEMDMAALMNVLIDDLQPLSYLSYSGTVFQVNAVLGDLYLWRGTLNDNAADYENAATAYRKLIYDQYLVVSKWRQSFWTSVNNTISSDATLNWINNMRDENVSSINCPTQYGQTYRLDTLANRLSIAPTDLALKAWDNQTYYLNEASSTKGDLRKWGSVSYSEASNKDYQWDLSFKKPTTTEFHIYKYKAYFQNVPVYRSALIYLRYAEAVNRLNKPNLAFAVLKYGLNNTNMTNPKIIPAKEKVSGKFPTYMNFSDARFVDNVGVRMRGLGNLDKDTSVFVIPRNTLTSMQDSVLFVENRILDELGLETAFEGNRFHDLMRIVYRRKIRNEDGDNFQAKTADMIANKHLNNAAGIKNKLVLSLDNWYIKY